MANNCAPREGFCGLYRVCIAFAVIRSVHHPKKRRLGVRTLSRAERYYLNAFRENDTRNPSVIGTSADLLSWQSAVIKAIARRVPDPDFSCPAPASECRWPPFWTMAVCSTCTKIWDYDRNCKDNASSIDCNYYSPSIPSLKGHSHVPGKQQDGRSHMVYSLERMRLVAQSQIFSSHLTTDNHSIVKPHCRFRVLPMGLVHTRLQIGYC
jgi:hypothetical protein